jgi:hypothetical protein
MDLRAYYRKLREIEAGFPEEFVLLKSRTTPDGGIAGRLTEVKRGLAAKMVADGVAEPAGEEEVAAFRQEIERQRKAAAERQAAQIQVAVLRAAQMLALGQRGPEVSKE